MRRLVALGLLATAGCSRALTPPLTVSAKRDLPSIRTLTVMPASPSASNAATVPAEAPVRVNRMLLEAASRETAWSVVDAKKTQAALDAIPADTVESRAGALAARVSADGALVATIGAYRERVGSVGLQRPAHLGARRLHVGETQRGRHQQRQSGRAQTQRGHAARDGLIDGCKEQPGQV
jgi:hypothetical protein